MKFDISPLRNLRGKDLSAQGLIALEGRIVVEKALESGTRLLGALVGADAECSWLERLKPEFPIERIPNAEIESIVGFKFHHGVLALAERPNILPFAPRDQAFDRTAAFLCLWNVTDPSNLGALARSAFGLGAAGLILGPGCADPFYRKTLRSSMGNVLSLPLYSCGLSDLGAAREAGLKLVAASLSPESLPISSFEAPSRLVLLLGNEGFGLPREVLDICDAQVYIPMKPGLDSLNVAAAGSILMYELFRRR
ncbi:MAG TPA: RNA methyltransferase [Rectinemataceae bacterium]